MLPNKAKQQRATCCADRLRSHLRADLSAISVYSSRGSKNKGEEMTANRFLLIHTVVALAITAVSASQYNQHKQADDKWRALYHNYQNWWEKEVPQAGYTEQTDPTYARNCKSTGERPSRLLKLMRVSDELEEKSRQWSSNAVGVWISLFSSIVFVVIGLFFIGGKKNI